MVDTSDLIKRLRERARVEAIRLGCTAEELDEWKASDELEAQQAEIERLRAACRWALGIEGEFPMREEGQPQFYWRTEFQKRVGALPPPHQEGE